MTVLNANQFLILNGAIVTLLLIFFFFSKTKQQPSRLNFKKGDTPLSQAQKALEGSAGNSLNVIFNYNGHSFDAYEVLGVPAGSTLEEIQQIYQKNRQISDPASQEFFRVAFESIKQHLQANNTKR